MPPGGVVPSRLSLTFEKTSPSALAGVAQNSPQVTKNKAMGELAENCHDMTPLGLYGLSYSALGGNTITRVLLWGYGSSGTAVTLTQMLALGQVYILSFTCLKY